MHSFMHSHLVHGLSTHLQTQNRQICQLKKPRHMDEFYNDDLFAETESNSNSTIERRLSRRLIIGFMFYIFLFLIGIFLAIIACYQHVRISFTNGPSSNQGNSPKTN